MWKKVIFAVVLVAFVGVQFANSLSCYSCKDAATCRNPTLQDCNNKTANESTTILSTLHNVPEIAGSQSFLCTNLTYSDITYKNRTSEFLGCVHPDIKVCDLNLKDGANSTAWRKDCDTCNTNYCNKNPAGTFSGSAYTMIGSVLTLLLAKIFS
ncbi:uncharacterized protein [Drosophila pseudoobscura]|uniref:Protein sleepless n=1 Tax=Drosophila pseudoobscura pseudoobscura TaxID=46245 RepID=A0A6I8UZ68_DROPS|nr:uncharacterized protein LOC6902399 [Drosophila pseudoobscura]